MKNLNKLEIQTYLILMISLIIDNLNGMLLLNGIGGTITIGAIYRYFMIVYFGYYIIKFGNKKWLLKISLPLIILIFISTLIHFMIYHSLQGLIMDGIYGVKLLFPFIMILYFYVLYKNKNITPKVIHYIFYTFMIIAPLSLIIPKVLNIGFAAYQLGGYKGFYYSNNEINVLLVCTFIYAIEQFYRQRKCSCFLFTLLNMIALFLIGSKTSLFVIGFVIFLYLLKLRNNKKLFFIVLAILLFGTIVFGILFSKQILDIFTRFEYFYDMLVVKKNGGILSFIMSERNIRIFPAFQKNILGVDFIYSILNLFFGIGRYQQVNPNVLNTLMELDFFDTFYWYGILITIVVFKDYIKIFIHSINKKNLYEYKLMYIIIFIFSMIAGHVWYSALASTAFALVGSMLLIQEEES